MASTENTLLAIKEKLERDGFEITWKNPFIEWSHGKLPPYSSTGPDDDNTFYIYDISVPKITPFDFVMVTIFIDDSIRFELSIFYSKALDDVDEADEIDKIYDKHAKIWSPKTTEYFSDIAIEHSLQWNTEYDVHIEDSLYGDVPTEQQDKVVLIMDAIKNNSKR